MGVPALFRWLTSKYPRLTEPAVEERPREINHVMVPPDASKPNPSGFETDNLYLDMNGIIHPCSHPEDKPAPETEEEMYIEIMKYIDRMFNIVRPRQVLYMAIDGVAPRAKMNQQRSRRFRAAQEAQDKAAAKEELLVANENLTGQKRPEEIGKRPFDSNCITPGTPFMANLAVCLRYYITERLNNNAGWRNLKVFLSDASVPGEGEHKIMSFIRHQRASPGYNPNTTHAIYGLDADLIMLSLATHEPHFKVLREDVFWNVDNSPGCRICGQPGHIAAECRGVPKKKVGIFDEKGQLVQRPYIWFHSSRLRECLAYELRVNSTPFPFDPERAIDDWIFMCFFVGNDFLPHLPSLEIREGAIDMLIDIYKQLLSRMDGYLTENGQVHLGRMALLLEELGRREDDIFRRRKEEEERRERKRRRRSRGNGPESAEFGHRSGSAAFPIMDMANFPLAPPAPPSVAPAYPQSRSAPPAPVPAPTPGAPATAAATAAAIAGVDANANRAAAAALKAMLAGGASTPKASDGAAPPATPTADTATETTSPPAARGSAKRKRAEAEVDEASAAEAAVPAADSAVVAEDLPDAAEDANADAPVVAAVVEEEKSADVVEGDTVRLGEDGWKERYYFSKFHADVADDKFVSALVRAYAEGVSWVMLYYYQGCPSWKWFFPDHYSPFASDFRLLGDFRPRFDRGQPFRPLEQLMAVFPPASKDLIPEPLHPLMTDPSSPIIDFYPTSFQIDLNGKQNAWQGVALLPFVDEKRLLTAITPMYEKLTDEERRLNESGYDRLFVSNGCKLFEPLCDVYGSTEGKVVTLNMKQHDGLAGAITRDKDAVMPGSTYPSPMPSLLKDITDNMVISVAFSPPVMPPGYVFQARILPGVRLPRPELTAQELYNIGRGGGGGGGFGGGGGGGRHGGSPQASYNANMQRAQAAGNHQAFLAPEFPLQMPPPGHGNGRGGPISAPGPIFLAPPGYPVPPGFNSAGRSIQQPAPGGGYRPPYPAHNGPPYPPQYPPYQPYQPR